MTCLLDFWVYKLPIPFQRFSSFVQHKRIFQGRSEEIWFLLNLPAFALCFCWFFDTLMQILRFLKVDIYFFVSAKIYIFVYSFYSKFYVQLQLQAMMALLVLSQETGILGLLKRYSFKYLWKKSQFLILYIRCWFLAGLEYKIRAY